jgi:hypothetical protein
VLAKPRPPTLEEVGLTQGSQFVLTPEQAEAQERQEAERLARMNAHTDAVLASVWESRDEAAEDALAGWLDRAEEARRRRDQRRKQQGRVAS